MCWASPTWPTKSTMSGGTTPPNRSRGVRITVSTSCFVPKSHTPFQWEGQNTQEEYLRKVTLLRENLRNKSITYNWHDPETSFLEAVLSRGTVGSPMSSRRPGATGPSLTPGASISPSRPGWTHLPPAGWTPPSTPTACGTGRKSSLDRHLRRGYGEVPLAGAGTGLRRKNHP